MASSGNKGRGTAIPYKDKGKGKAISPPPKPKGFVIPPPGGQRKGIVIGSEDERKSIAARSPDERKDRDRDRDRDRGYGYMKDGSYNEYVEYVSYYFLTACHELITRAKDYVSSWSKDILSSMFFLDHIQKEFRDPLPHGKRLEVSVATAIIPISASDLAKLMMNATEWSTLLFPMVYSAQQLPCQIFLKDLKQMDASIEEVARIGADFAVPTPFVPMRSFEFFRYRKRITEDICVVVDISSLYFGSEFLAVNSNCLRRPSGVIIRQRGPKFCEIIVVENVVVDYPNENVYHTLLNTPNSVFSASHWINVVLWKRMRDRSRILSSERIMDPADTDALLAVTRAMKSSFMEFVCGKQKNHELIPISGNEIMILRSKTTNSSLHDYLGVKCLEVKASPSVVFDFLVKHDLRLKLPWGPSLMLKFVSKHGSNAINLYNTQVSERNKLYCLQEASRGEYCSFVLSIVVSDVNEILSEDILEKLEGEEYEMVPTGFAILPYRRGGLSCPASLVTILGPFHEKDLLLTALKELDNMV